MKLRYTPSAKAEFLAVLSFISDDNPAAAEAFRKRAYVVLRRLEHHPASGRIIPEFPELRYREVIVAPFRFFYRTEGNSVWIVAIWHGAQQVRNRAEPAFKRMVQRGLEDSRAGRTISNAKLKQRMRRWRP